MDLIELNRKYWGDIIDMGKKFSIDPWKLIKITDDWNDIVECDTHPNLRDKFDEGCKIEFAIAIKDEIPIFQNDIMYTRDGTEVTCIDAVSEQFLLVDIVTPKHNKLKTVKYYIQDLYFEPPVKTIKLSIKECEYIRKKLNLISIDDDAVIESGILKKL